MEVSSIPSHQKNLSVVNPLVLGAIIAAASAGIQADQSNSPPKVTLSNDGRTLEMSHKKEVIKTSTLEADTSRIWKTPHDNSRYFKIKNVDEDFISDNILPVSTIPSDEMLNRTDANAFLSPPAIADKMMQEASLMAYDSFTGMTRSLLNGRVPSNAFVADGSDDDDSYGDRIASRVRSVTHGSWFTVVQASGHFFDQDPMNDLSGFKSSGYGLNAALLCPLSEQWLVGMYGSWQKLNGDLRHTSGSVETGSWKLGPTLSWSAGAIHAEGLLTYSWNKIDNKVKGYSGEYKIHQWDSYLRGGYDLDLEGFAHGLSLTPDLQVLYSSQDREGFSWVNNKMNGATSKGWTTRLGGTLGYDRLQFEQPLELKLAAGWQYNQFKTENLTAPTGEYRNDSHYDRHGIYYSAGVDTQINEAMNLNLNYSGLWSSNALGHYLQAGVEYRF